MPKVSGRYVMFLNVIPDSDVYKILTGYELGFNGVSFRLLTSIRIL